MSEVASCPSGTAEAGKAAQCEGCPSRNICATGQTGPDPDIAKIAQTLSEVKKKVVVLSGKGGVGKSTVSALLARAFAADDELEIGLLDIDITGPSQTLFMGVKNEEVHKSASGWTPGEFVSFRLKRKIASSRTPGFLDDYSYRFRFFLPARLTSICIL